MARVLSFHRPTSFRSRSPLTPTDLTLTTLLDDLYVLAAHRPRAIEVFATVAHRMAAPLRDHRRKLTRRSRPMKRTTIWLLVFALAAATPLTAAPLPFSAERLDRAIDASGEVLQAACDTSRATGRNDADERHGTAGWFLGSLGAGLAATFIGMGAVMAGAGLGNPQPKEIPPNVDEQCYRDGYKSKAKNKNVMSSLFGGLIGSVIWIGIYSAAVD